MVKDYTTNLLTVKKLIRKYGRNIVLRQLDPVSSVPGMPWLSASDPVATGIETSLYAVSMPATGVTSLGIGFLTDDLIKNVVTFFIAEPGETSPENIDIYNTVVEGSTEYKILSIDKLKPANLTLLYYIGVGR